MWRAHSVLKVTYFSKSGSISFVVKLFNYQQMYGLLHCYSRGDQTIEYFIIGPLMTILSLHPHQYKDELY